MLSENLPSILKNKLIQGSIFLFAATFIGNIFNAVYNFAMARLLGPSDYADLMALISILYILTFPSIVLNNVITRFSALFSARSDFSRLHNLFEKVTLRTIIVGLTLSLVFGLSSNFLKDLLKISHPVALILTGLLGLLFFLITINLGTLTGILKFKSVAIANLFWPISRLILSVFLVVKGFSVSGAIAGFTISSLFTYLITLIPLKFLWYFREKETKLEWGELGKYAVPASLSLLGLTLLVNTDILFVKAYFPNEQAGIYSASALLAKVILFSSLPIIMMIFPLITQKFEAKEDYSRLFFAAFGLILAISLGALFWYWLSPQFFINLIFGKAYSEASNYLFNLGIFISLYSMVYLFNMLWLSIGEIKFSLISLFGAALQAALIFYSHSSINQIIFFSILSNLLLLLLNVGYFSLLRRKV